MLWVGCPGWAACLVGASSCTPKGCGFEPWSGHIPRWWVQALVWVCVKGPTSVSLLPALPPFPPPLLNQSACGRVGDVPPGQEGLEGASGWLRCDRDRGGGFAFHPPPRERQRTGLSSLGWIAAWKIWRCGCERSRQQMGLHSDVPARGAGWGWRPALLELVPQ